MTTINDISDLVRVLQERPDWLSAVRNLVVGEDLLDLPQQVARFVEATEENFRQLQEQIRQNREQIQQNRELIQQNRELIQQVQEQTRQIQEQNRLTHQQLDWLGGRAGNYDGAVYERRVRTRILLRLMQTFGMEAPVIVFHQEGLIAPEMNRLFQQAPRAGLVRHDEIADLQETDIIITDQEGGGHAVIEVSITADNDDIMRAERRARIMSLASGVQSVGMVATDRLPGSQESFAKDRGVTVLTFPNR